MKKLNFNILTTSNFNGFDISQAYQIKLHEKHNQPLPMGGEYWNIEISFPRQTPPTDVASWIYKTFKLDIENKIFDSIEEEISNRTRLEQIISETPALFSTSAYRNFKNFVGILTASAAGVDISISYTIKTANLPENETDLWRFLGKKFGDIYVCGLNSTNVRDGATRLNILSLYSGFDLFLNETRAQYFNLHDKAWQQNDKETPFDAIRNNCPLKQYINNNRFRLLVAAIDYYRIIRNYVSHPSNENLAKIQEFYTAKNTEVFSKIRNIYGTSTAPNAFNALSFHDIKLMARILLDLCQIIDRAYDPGNSKIQSQIPKNLIQHNMSDDRKKSTIVGWLKTEFGVSSDRANEITRAYFDSLAQR